jgi:glutamate carboxypeptidase
VIVSDLAVRTPDMLDALERLVMVESPSSDVEALWACADAIASFGSSMIGRDPERLDADGRPHLWWRTDEPRVLLLGHFDTVWPLGTTDRWPFEVRGDVASGPGTFDMKAGIVQGFFALTGSGAADRVDLLLTSDEELGSPTSRELIEDAARRVEAVLVLEPSERGALKIARKGCSTYVVEITGRAAHAGLNPEDGANALVELAHQVLAIDALGNGDTTVTPTLATAGTTTNVVPASATLFVDVRTPTAGEHERIDAVLRGLRAIEDGVSIDVQCRSDRPPLPSSASAELFVRAERCAGAVGIDPLDGVEVGGGSDGNFTAAVGTPTLDGLGAVGAGAHAEGEHVIVEKMAERAALVAALIDDLCKGEN